jgi:membrane protease YdiL (CAAX protease family)
LSRRTARRIPHPGRGTAWRFAPVPRGDGPTVIAGFARWDPKLPAWWPLWTWSMVFLTALPEEALFRHVIQGGLQDWLGGTSRTWWIPMVVAGVLFGLAHLAGGWTSVALATLAGIGYGWISRRQRIDRRKRHWRTRGSI